MKSRTGLRTANGETRHCPWVILNERDVTDILQWLPEGGDTTEMLRATLQDAQDKAKALNDQMDADEARWAVTKRKWLAPGQ